MSGDQWVAVAGVAAGVAGTVGGYLFGYFNGRAERSHAENLSRAARLHDQRLAGYEELSTHLELEREFLKTRRDALDYPRTGDDKRHQRPGEEEWMKIRGRVGVAGSAAVLEAIDRVWFAMMTFEIRLSSYDVVLSTKVAELIGAKPEDRKGFKTLHRRGLCEPPKRLAMKRGCRGRERSRTRAR